MKLLLISEAAPSDLMPSTPDPYGSAGADVAEPLPAEPPAEPPPAPEPDTELPPDEGQDLLGADGDQDLQMGDQAEELPPSPLEMADWMEQESADRRDRTFTHKDGFHLRIRELDSNPNKLLAQLYNSSKILDKGFISVPEGTDPMTYIQDVAEKMLNLEKGPEAPMPSPAASAPVPPEIPLNQMMPTAPEEV